MPSNDTLTQPLPLAAPSELYRAIISRALAERRRTFDISLSELSRRSGALADLAARIVQVLVGGNKVLVAGNGGSAAEAQHFAAELIGRFKREREPFAVLALTTDTSALTAIANDYGYGDVFSRQVLGLGQPGDLLLAFSTSGESENLIRATEAGHTRRMTVAAVTGERTSRLGQMADITIRVPVADTATTQELHMLVTHIVCDIVESELGVRAKGPLQ